MTDDVAHRLLDAQVEWVLAELTGKRLAKVIARDVDDLLALGDDIRLDALVDAEQAKASLRRIVEKAGGAPLGDALVTAFADAVYDLPAADDHLLGDVVARQHVETLVDRLLAMRTLHERAMERMTQSPLVSTVAARFVGSIVNDFVAQNRQLAEKVPGAKSLFSLGASAANRVKNDGIIADAADRGTQMAIRRTNGALREVMADAPLKEAALELWDLHAGEPVGELRRYLSRDELRELVALAAAAATDARTSEYAGAALDACVDAVFERYGDWSVTAVLGEAGVTRDDLVDELERLVPPAVEAAKEDGRLAELVRARLAPFFASKKVKDILAG
jgi:hypothetical protein